jgi:alpha-tubulin suppressor-like RCC1 family protein
VDTDGQVLCFGQSFRSWKVGSVVPRPVYGLNTVTTLTVSKGGEFACAIEQDGHVSCWGRLPTDFHGSNYTEDGVRVDGLEATSVISAGSSHVCAITSNGTFCWGQNERGQVGVEGHQIYASPAQVQSGGRFTNIATGSNHTCGINEAAEVWCWGANYYGQLGLNHQNDAGVPTKVDGISGAISLAAASNSTCAITDDSRVFCWGSNAERQLTFPSDTWILTTPTEISALSGISDLSAGGDRYCGLRDQQAICWGDNQSAAIVDENLPSVPPTVIALDFEVSKIVVGSDHICTLSSENEVFCQGSSLQNQIGPKQNTNPIIPTDITIPDHKEYILGNNFDCIIDPEDRVKCWGIGLYRAFEPGNRGSPQSPIDTGVTDALQLAVGMDVICALTKNSEIYCWSNSQIRLVEELQGTPKKIFAGYQNVCQVSEAELALCNIDYNFNWDWFPPETPYQIRKIVIVSPEQGIDPFIVVLLEDGTVGDGAQRAIFDPSTGLRVGAEPLDGIVDVVGGIGHFCALMVDKSVMCWGRNIYGQIGSGDQSKTSYIDATKVPQLSNVKKIVAGAYHTCALLESGPVKCWGNNYYGQIGNASSDIAWSPETVLDLGVGVVDIKAGHSRTYFVLENGRTKYVGRTVEK